MNPEYIKKLVRLTRPRAKFIALSDSREFLEYDKFPGFIKPYFYVNLYDEQIDSVFNRLKDGSFYLIQNTYLSSFAYNLFLTIIYNQNKKNYPSSELFSDPDLIQLLTHNFKKFFAEQLYASHNSIFSRAILLETLLYEQKWMVPVFAEKATNQDLAGQAKLASDIMSSLVLFHEMGHYFLSTLEDLWPELLQEYNSSLLPLYRHIEPLYVKAFLTEFRCDAVSIISCLSEFEGKEPLRWLLIMFVVGFASFAVMMSLVKSAQATSNKHRLIKESVDFYSIEKVKRDYDFTLGKDMDFIERAKLMIEFCRLIGESKNVNIFEKGEGISLPQNILDYFLGFIDKIMDSQDDNARKMSMLVAESLHDHPDGAEYIYLRSKTFESNRALEL